MSLYYHEKTFNVSFTLQTTWNRSGIENDRFALDTTQLQDREQDHRLIKFL